ncbi:MAG: S1C family serine protease, partial [Acidimicrobiales bacterium]
MGVTASDPRHGNRTKDRAEPLAGPAGAERLPFDSLAQRRPPGSQEPGRAGRAGRASRVLAIGLAAGLVGGAGGAAALATGAGLWDRTTSPGPAGPAVTPAPAPGTPGAAGVPALLKKVLPGVVSIETSLASGQRGAGTGVIVSAGGDVLTNAHVVNGATSISVTRYGTNSPLEAQLVGATPSEDLALVHIPGASGLPAATLGTSGNVPVGTSVVAVGNALGLSAGTPTATVGIISAEGRSVTTEAHGQNVTLTGLFQTDAAINPGNSGGPLFDQSGKVVAINTAVAGSAEGIGFAIPID